jgi:EAL and modified HD-GYP domain-containing signal transduction protein
MKNNSLNAQENNQTPRSIVARQPIVNSDKTLFAYELLYREGANNAFPDASNAHQATLRLLAEQYLSFQQKHLERHLGFVNFDEKSLLENVPMDFCKDEFVIEILESCEPTQALYDAVHALKQRGYMLALDDYQPASEWERFYPLVDYIKLDIQAIPLSDCAALIRNVKQPHILFLAEKVETHDEFQQAKDIGFSLFQGYFFQKPEMMESKKLSASAMDIFKLSSLVAAREINYLKINQIIARNPALSLQLLKFVNNDSRINQPIKNLQQALAYLGDERIRKYVTYTALAALAPSKPDVLLTSILHRARFMENISRHLSFPECQESAYLCGMLSLMGGLLDMSLEAILNSLAVDEVISQALLNRSGPTGHLLTVVEAVEHSNWEQLHEVSKVLQVNEGTIMQSLEEAHCWVG